MGFRRIIIAVIIGIGVLLDMERKRINSGNSGGNTPSAPTKKYNMEFEYRQISAKRRREINRMRIRDRSASKEGTVFSADGRSFVTNKDESVLFCRSHIQENPGQGERQAVFFCIRDNECCTFAVDLDREERDRIYVEADLMTAWNHMLSEFSLLRYYIHYDEQAFQDDKMPS